MKFFILKTLFLTGMLLLSSCTLFEHGEDFPTEPKVIPVSPLTEALIESSNEFGLDLMKRVSAQKPGNLMISPLSASINLTMLLNGTSANTRTQIQEMLGYPADQSLAEINVSYRELVDALVEADPAVTLEIANAIFYRKDFSFKAPFLSTMKDDFNASVQGLDFLDSDAVRIINRWASDNTNRKIPKVIDSIQREMVMFILNAVYFKGNWTSQFDASKTQNMPFYVNPMPNGEGEVAPHILVPTMRGKVTAMTYYSNDYKAIELPYGRKNFVMTIVEPAGSLQPFIETLSSHEWNALTFSPAVGTGQGSWRQVDVELPKFTFSYEKVLNDDLKALGMIDAFDPNSADLSGISDADLFVSFVKQNTFVEVNEKGTEAAAVTTTGIELTSLPPVFQINKPFVFIIRERSTNTVLFIGKVVNPLETE